MIPPGVCLRFKFFALTPCRRQKASLLLMYTSHLNYQNQMDTRSGEILSAWLSMGFAVGLALNPDTSLFHALSRNVSAYWWAAFAASSGSFGLWSTLPKASHHMYFLSRFMSGCLWGSIAFTFFIQARFVPIFFAASILFVFDFITVIKKGRTWDSETRHYFLKN